jgi:hypothetical protein
MYMNIVILLNVSFVRATLPFSLQRQRRLGVFSDEVAKTWQNDWWNYATKNLRSFTKYCYSDEVQKDMDETCSTHRGRKKDKRSVSRETWKWENTERPRRGREDNINICIKNTSYEVAEWVELTRDSF